MKFTTGIWLVLAILYASFFYWYTSFGGPLSPEEIRHYSKILTEDDTLKMDVSAWIKFMETDTGDDFVMLNTVHHRDSPQQIPGVNPGDSSEEVLGNYDRPFLRRAMKSAAHPVLFGNAAAEPLDLWGIEGATGWTAGGVVRYRSRRDLMEQIVAMIDGPQIHDLKIAALEKTIAYPLDPWFHLGDPRVILAFAFLVIGLGCDAIGLRVRRRRSQ